MGRRIKFSFLMRKNGFAERILEIKKWHPSISDEYRKHRIATQKFPPSALQQYNSCLAIFENRLGLFNQNDSSIRRRLGSYWLQFKISFHMIKTSHLPRKFRVEVLKAETRASGAAPENGSLKGVGRRRYLRRARASSSLPARFYI